MADVLNLAGADMKGFDAVPSGPYDCVIHEVTSVEVEGEDGKLPKGTPGYNVQFKVEGGEYDNRRFFQRFFIAPPDYDADKKKKLDGMFARFLAACGYSEQEITSGKFKFDPDDLIGREVTVLVGQKDYQGETRNTVRNVKARSANLEEAGII